MLQRRDYTGAQAYLRWARVDVPWTAMPVGTIDRKLAVSRNILPGATLVFLVRAESFCELESASLFSSFLVLATSSDLSVGQHPWFIQNVPSELPGPLPKGDLLLCGAEYGHL